MIDRATRAGGRFARRIPSGDERGAALVEFALVASLFFFILYALIAFGMMLALKQSVTNAAAEGARAVVGVADDPNTSVNEREAKAKNTVMQRLEWLGSKRDNVTVTPLVRPCDADGGTCIKVTVTYPYGTKPLVPNAPIVGDITPDNLSSDAEVKIAG